MGFAGHMGFHIDPISAIAPTIILTLAIADSVHILVSLLGLMRQGQDKLTALRESLRINLLAVSITSLTTIVGFLALNFSDAPPFRLLGDITAVGIAAAWLYSITVLPALIRLLPVNVKISSSRSALTEKWLSPLARLVTTHHRAILVTTVAAAIATIALVPRLNLEDSWIEYFDERIEFRRDAEYALDHLTGLYLIDYSLDSGRAEGINEPAFLSQLDDFTIWLRQQPEVLHVFSYADIIKRLNKNMHGDDQSWYRLPDERELAAQYLLLYELSLPYGLDLNDRINVDKSATRVTATMRDMSTAEVRAFLDRSREWLRRAAHRRRAHRADTDVRVHLETQHRQHAARQRARRRADLDHPDAGDSQPAHGRPQPGAQRSAGADDLRRLGTAGRRGGHGSGNRVGDLARDHRRQHRSLSHQVHSRPARKGPRPARRHHLCVRDRRSRHCPQRRHPGLRIRGAGALHLQGQRRNGSPDRDRGGHRPGRGLPAPAFPTHDRNTRREKTRNEATNDFSKLPRDVCHGTDRCPAPERLDRHLLGAGR